MKRFILMLQFMTRIPLKMEIKATEEDFAKGVVYFPLVGFIIGAFDLGVYLLVSKVVGGWLPLICAVLANVAITGGLHIDGLADTCDGIFSARSRERMLEIMKDSRIGTNGAIAIIFDFLLRLGILGSLDTRLMVPALLLSPVIAKTLVVVLIYTSINARGEGSMGGLFMGKKSPWRLIICCILGIALIYLFLQKSALVIFGVCLIGAMLYKSYIYSKLKGMTGDTLGAANEFLELIYLSVLLAMGVYGLI